MPFILTTGTEMYEKDGFQKFFIENLHPSKQFDQLLKLVEKCLVENSNFLFYLNNEVMVQHFNNLILLHQQDELSKKTGYRGLGIDPADIQMFEYINGKHIQLKLGDYGFQVNWMNIYLNDLFTKSIEIQTSVDEDV